MTQREISAAGFLNFVFNSDPDIKLDHDNGYDKCAIGLYAQHLGAATPGQVYEVADTLYILFNESENNPTAEMLDTYGEETNITLMEAMDQPHIMDHHAPTMGELQKFIVEFYQPLIPA